MNYLLPLNSADGVNDHIRYIDLFPFDLDLGVFSYKEPAAVGEKEATLCIVGVGVGFAVFVVHSVITDPVEKRPLISSGIAAHQEKSERKVSLESAMGKQSVSPYNNPHACNAWRINEEIIVSWAEADTTLVPRFSTGNLPVP